MNNRAIKDLLYEQVSRIGKALSSPKRLEILEMLAQSDGTDIHLLPALPSAWPQGHVQGLRLRGGVTLEMEWQAGALRRLVIQCARPFSGQVLSSDGTVLARSLLSGRTALNLAM